jgi:hypothetical protein
MNLIEPPVLLNQPQAILKAWTALEVLSPQTYKRPEELISGEGHIAQPWPTPPLHQRGNKMTVCRTGMF